MSLVSSLKTFAKRTAGTACRWNGVVGVNYHRIGNGRESKFDRGLWSATTEGFDAHLRWLKANFDVISPLDILTLPRRGRGRHVLITFDDGYEDNFTQAYPVLRAHRLPATFFVATGFIDELHVAWWDEIAWMVRMSQQTGAVLPDYLVDPIAYDEPDRERAVRALLRVYYHLPSARSGAFLDAVARATGSGRCSQAIGERIWMTWDMLREMSAGGMTIGGHTIHHPILARMPRAEQFEEIAGCGRRIEQEIGVAMRVFAYPVGQRGSFDGDTRACLKEVGVTLAFSYYGGFRPLNAWDNDDVPRIAVEQNTTFDEFRAEVLAPWLNRFVSVRGRMA